MAFLALICGPIASGKTYLCARLHRCLIDAGYLSSGIVEETSRNEAGLPVDISFRHLASGDKWQWTERDPTCSPLAPFVFPEAPMAAAIDRLVRDSAAGFSPLILDEIGLLEICDGKGFLEWLLGYLGKSDSFLIVTLREGREESFMAALEKAGFPGGSLVVKAFHVEEKSRKTCLDSLCKWVFRHCPNDVGKLYLN